MKITLSMLRFALLALALLAPAPLVAQTVVRVPTYVDNSPGNITDLGNGPMQLKILTGSAQVWSMSGSGVGSTTGSSTALVLTTTPLTLVPCVGCAISGTGITAGTTITAFNGGTSLTLSAAMTVASGTALAWGSACPTSVGSNRVMLLQAAVGGDPPLYTYARICAAGQNAAGAQLLTFPIGAH